MSVLFVTIALAQHVSRPVAECPISFVGNVCGCLKLQSTHIRHAQVTLDKHNRSGNIRLFSGTTGHVIITAMKNNLNISCLSGIWLHTRYTIG